MIRSPGNNRGHHSKRSRSMSSGTSSAGVPIARSVTRALQLSDALGLAEVKFELIEIQLHDVVDVPPKAPQREVRVQQIPQWAAEDPPVSRGVESRWVSPKK